MSESLGSLAEVMRQVAEDCATDAAALDSTPFTPRGIGEALGAILAMIAAVAKGVELLAAEIERLSPKDGAS